MILRSGNAASFLVEFPSGPPDGNLNWSLLGPNGAAIETGSIDAPDNAVSANIVISAAANTLGAGVLSAHRDLVWMYEVGGTVVNGERRYTLEARLPFGVSPDGVRRKLGVEAHNLPDSEISLVSAYHQFSEMVDGSGFPLSPLTDMQSYSIREAIEAMAALALIPTMQVRVALKESSGTDTFQRDEIDWEVIADSLAATVLGGVLILVPTFDPSFGFGAIFILASPTTDAITGGGATG